MNTSIITSLALYALTICSQAQQADLKTLIGKAAGEAKKNLSAWGIKVSMSQEYPDVLVGYNDGIQIKLEKGKVTTIWVEFTDRRTGAFPHSIDALITPKMEMQKAIDKLGQPSASGDPTRLGNMDYGGWIKWKTEKYQLHCEVQDGKIIMVTIMEPDWTYDK